MEDVSSRTGLTALVRGAITGWALAGGCLMLVVVLVNVISVAGGALLGRPFPGDFELSEMGVCISAFAFLPYCQLTYSNVTADIFTANASPRNIAVLTLVGSLVALVFGSLLLWRMWLGMLDQKDYDYTTAILQVPHWWAFLPILVSLFLLAAAALLTLLEQSQIVRQNLSNG
ncbi:MAG: TRAP-type C4-dicarboxylate transport system permease small subunit [Parasphingorhabdus sp.]|jgi:TRAP-type C4-dicarboxylate transport system permease small subunit